MPYFSQSAQTTGEEDRGRCLDLVNAHTVFVTTPALSGAVVQSRAATADASAAKRRATKAARKRKRDGGSDDEPMEDADAAATTAEPTPPVPTAETASAAEASLDYQSFVAAFPNVLLLEVPRKTRLTASYREYVDGVSAYLLDFLARTQPLFDASAAIKSAVDAAADAIPADDAATVDASAHTLTCGPATVSRVPGRGVAASVRDVPGWDGGDGVDEAGTGEEGDGGDEGSLPTSLPLSVLDAYATQDAVARALADSSLLGGDAGAKRVLASLGVKSGGTPAERAHRLFALRGRTSLDGLDKSMLAKPKKGGGGPTANAPSDDERRALLAVLRNVRASVIAEARLRALASLPVSQAVLADTLARVQFKLSRTAEEAAEDDARRLAEQA